MKTRDILSLLLAVTLIATLLPGCGKDSQGSTNSPNSTTGTVGDTGKQEEHEATETVLCLTQISSSYEGEEWVYNVTYEEDGIHVSPKTLADNCVYVYHPSGDMNYELYYDSDGGLSETVHYTYDAAGQLIKESHEEPDGTVKYTFNYEYDQQGRKIRSYNTNGSDFITDTNLFVYDDAGNLTSEDHYDYNNELALQYIHRYDGDRCTRIDIQRTGQAITGHWALDYDEDGRLLSKLYHSDSIAGGQWNGYTLSYDDAGRVVCYAEYFGTDNLHSSYTYTYNSEGYLITSEETVDGITATFVYAEAELTETLAQMAKEWSTEGVKNAYTTYPEN